MQYVVDSVLLQTTVRNDIRDDVEHKMKTSLKWWIMDYF